MKRLDRNRTPTLKNATEHIGLNTGNDMVSPPKTTWGKAGRVGATNEPCRKSRNSLRDQIGLPQGGENKRPRITLGKGAKARELLLISSTIYQKVHRTLQISFPDPYGLVFKNGQKTDNKMNGGDPSRFCESSGGRKGLLKKTKTIFTQ